MYLFLSPNQSVRFTHCSTTGFSALGAFLDMKQHATYGFPPVKVPQAFNK